MAEKVLHAKSQPVLNVKKAVSTVAQSPRRPKLDDDRTVKRRHGKNAGKSRGKR